MVVPEGVRRPAALGGRAVFLNFDGINYRANIWLNGQRLADAREAAGAFRRYSLDVTRWARAGARNAVAVEVFAPEVTDLALTWVDWSPMPPDKNMGLWSDVYVTDSGPIALRHPHVVTRLDLPSLDVAHLTVTAEAINTTDRAVQGTLRGTIGEIRFQQSVALTATGVIQWMLNNAWPSMIWHLYDYYLRPGGGYYGTKKACEPLHVL